MGRFSDCRGIWTRVCVSRPIQVVYRRNCRILVNINCAPTIWQVKLRLDKRDLEVEFLNEAAYVGRHPKHEFVLSSNQTRVCSTERQFRIIVSQSEPER